MPENINAYRQIVKEIYFRDVNAMGFREGKWIDAIKSEMQSL
jgi:hypothetical protein